MHIENRRYRTFVPDVKQALNFEMPLILHEEQTKLSLHLKKFLSG